MTRHSSTTCTKQVQAHACNECKQGGNDKATMTMNECNSKKDRRWSNETQKEKLQKNERPASIGISHGGSKQGKGSAHNEGSRRIQQRSSQKQHTEKTTMNKRTDKYPSP